MDADLTKHNEWVNNESREEIKRYPETVWSFLKKLKMELPYDPVISLMRIYEEKKAKTLIQKNIYTPIFIAALFAIAKIWKQPKCPSVDEWMKGCGTFTEWSTTRP